jgi:phenylalanyl-tRNA synthetase beta subunit
MNQKIPFDKFALFEMNKIYRKDWGMDDEDVPTEKMNIALVLAERKTTGDAYYKAKLFVEKYLAKLNIEATFKPLKTKTAEALPFEPKRSAEVWVGDQYLGVVGEFKAAVKHNFKLADYLAGFELDLLAILELESPKLVAKDFEIKDKQDLTVTSTKTYAEVLAEVREKYPEAEISPVGIYQPEGKEEKNITFHLEFR